MNEPRGTSITTSSVLFTSGNAILRGRLRYRSLDARVLSDCLRALGPAARVREYSAGPSTRLASRLARVRLRARRSALGHQPLRAAGRSARAALRHAAALAGLDLHRRLLHP